MLRLTRPTLVNWRVFGQRRFSHKVKVSPEVRDAVETKKPVVALESTIITHGLPYPENLKMAKDVEQVIRDNGAIPATTAFVHGSPMVGLNDEHLEYLSNTSDLVKVSRRDVPLVMSKRLSGGTTIAGTMILAHRAGVKVFATGGLGGVHRGAETTMDVSADLDELARTPVGVVCSGPKSILDIEKTMEYLETKGVPVLTYGPKGTNIPGFYTSDSGVPSPYNFQTCEEAGELLHANEQMKLGNGSVFCVPTPPELSMSKDFINGIIEQAVKDAQAEGIQGKLVTPYLLKRIWENTKGDSLATNVGFVKNNAVIAARIAVHLSSLEGYTPRTFTPPPTPPKIPPVVETVEQEHPAPQPPSPLSSSSHEITKSDAVVVGTLAMDMTCNLDGQGDTLLHTSTPGKVETSLGGVGHNIALAAAYSGGKLGVKTRLVTELGPDSEPVISRVEKEGLESNGIKQTKDKTTARYIAMHDRRGELVVACADMESAGKLDVEWIREQITKSHPKCVFFDGNIGAGQKQAVVAASRKVGALVGFEPASVQKAAWLADLPQSAYPHHSVDVCTPNAYEISALYNAYKDRELFDTDSWFPVVDSFQIGDTFRTSMENLAQVVPALKDINTSGLVQQAIHLLPYIPNLFVKRGSSGVISFQLIENASKVQQSTSPNLQTPSGLKVHTRICIGRGDRGILVQYFPTIKLNDSNVVSVTGAGDTFCGVLISHLAQSREWLHTAGFEKAQVMDRAQKCAAYTVQSELAVNPMIREVNVE